MVTAGYVPALWMVIFGVPVLLSIESNIFTLENPGRNKVGIFKGVPSGLIQGG